MIIRGLRAPRLNCEEKDCPLELIHPPEDCNVNSSLSFTLQVVHFAFVYLLFILTLFILGFQFALEFYLWVSVSFQICRVEDIDVAGLVQGTVVHFHRARSVVVSPTGRISATGLGMSYLLQTGLKIMMMSYIYYIHHLCSGPSPILSV